MSRPDRDPEKRSKYGMSYGTHIPKGEKRVKIKHGRFEDAKRYYRCWNCGFPIDSERETSGDAGDVAMKIHEQTDVEARISPSEVYTFEITGWRESGINLLYADGTLQMPKVVQSTVSTGGCPFCGTKNWK
jgi:hypothetical protein